MKNEKLATTFQISDERTAYLARCRRTKILTHTWRIGILTAFFALWEILTRVGVLDSFIVSSPSRILKTIENIAQNKLLMHIGVTLYETLTGFLLGAAIGLIISVALWASPFASRVFEPYLVVLNSLPKIALRHVIIILVGAGTRAIIVMALAISLIVTVLEMLAGFKSTDPEIIKMARLFGADRRQILMKIVLPANVATLFGSLKINIGLSLVGVIAGEFLVSRAGLGYLIVYGGQVFQLDLVMTGVLILSLLAACMYEAVVIIEKAVLKRVGA